MSVLSPTGVPRAAPDVVMSVEAFRGLCRAVPMARHALSMIWQIIQLKLGSLFTGRHGSQGPSAWPAKNWDQV